MARHDQNRRDMRNAYGRYSGSEQGDDRRRAERRDHGLYGHLADEAPGYDREHTYYDPDQRYRGHDGYGRREYFRHEYSGNGGDQPYANRPYPGDYGRHDHDGIREGDREAWRERSSWLAGDSGGAASHRGRGPKGYLRSDDRIREDVCDCLTDDPHIDASDVEVSVKDGEVTLTGKIESRDARRHAEELAQDLSGVKHVQNNLRVGERLSDGSARPQFTRTGSDKR